MLDLTPSIAARWLTHRAAPGLVAAAVRDRARAAPANVRLLLPGLLVVAALAGAARLVALAVAPWALTPGVEVIVGLLLGLAVANALALPASATAGAKFASQRILRLGIILIGRASASVTWRSSASARSAWWSPA